MNKKKFKLSPKEYVWYILSLIMVTGGLVQIILGLIVEFANVKVSDFPLYNGNQDLIGWSKLGFLNWGLIWLAVGVVLAVLVLCIFATTNDRNMEKQSRRAARLNKINVSEAQVKEPDSNEEIHVEKLEPSDK